ncbi:HdeD family acid-resistance protein [Enterovirga rhinocerotis]|uniref:Uncharacterized membrane protein HdeD (DUF308 family) n=1 Tax=Enterovirga rhinocerotis TaxID=1339210 RepID=A0A4R7CC03_9HYPH|nr:HdeD family acid-resistance protein [Enterovirga rhinocerotis]TDR94656.1 uncharacterized membrane protein HdeD (DUF308 family) [Enterovirga rhinocerotis]
MSTAPTASPDTDGSILGQRSALLARNWWVVALRGAFGILFGVLTLLLPGVTLVSLVYVFAAYLLIDGALAIAAAVRAARAGERWGLLILEGIVDLVGAAAMVAIPGLAIVFFIYLVAGWSIVSGVFEVVAAFQLHLDHGRWWLVLAGIVSIAFGLLIAIAPIAGAIVLAVWIGAYAIVFGTMLLVLGFRLKSRHQAAA